MSNTAALPKGDAVSITVQCLLADEAVKALVGNKIRNLVSGERDKHPYVVVYLVSESTNSMLEGPDRRYRSRVSVDCQSNVLPEIHAIAEAVKDALEPIHLREILGCECSFWKEGTDVTEFGGQAGIGQRVLDFYLEWRRLG